MDPIPFDLKHPAARTVAPTYWSTPLSDASLQQIVSHLAGGQLLVLPTETVYGLAARWDCPSAVGQIYAVKGRPLHHPLIVHLPVSWRSLPKLEQMGWLDRSQLSAGQYEQLEALVQHCWPGPCTLLLPHCHTNPIPFASHLPTIAVRIPSHPVMQAILTALDKPLLMPSANPFGQLSPTTLQLAWAGLAPQLIAGVDGGPCLVGIESTIVAAPSLAEPTWRLLRSGGTTKEQLQAWLGELVVDHSAQVCQQGAQAPGMLSKHYAPRTPLALWLPSNCNGLNSVSQGQLPQASNRAVQQRLAQSKQICVLLQQERPMMLGWLAQHYPGLDVQVCYYGARNDPTGQQTAQQLYATLAAVDGHGSDLLLMEYPSLSGHFWSAIQDRLKRAATAGALHVELLH